MNTKIIVLLPHPMPAQKFPRKAKKERKKDLIEMAKRTNAIDGFGAADELTKLKQK